MKPDPQKEQSKASGAAQTHQSAYPLDNFTVSPKTGEEGGEKSPYFKSQAPSISLPKGGGALKGIDEKFTVNAVNGTASLQVQMPFTPGRGGFTPAISLSYNSGGGNDEFGLGWSSNLPSIQRKTDKKLPFYDDVNESDIFLLAGAEDLVPELDTSGNRVVITSSPYTVKRYKPRIEGLFACIEHITKSGVTGSWWKVTSKENTVTFYGLSTEAQIADPADASRIFKWLPQLSYDKKGNVQLYNYVTDSAASFAPTGVHERNRINGIAPFTNTYITKVSWCNASPFTASSDYEPSMTGVTFLMYAAFDYGNYSSSDPTVSTGAVTKRMDAFSDFHAGFEIRTYRKCKRVLMFHTFSELFTGMASPPSACLVKSLDIAYANDGVTALCEADYITAITQTSYLLKTDGTYISKTLPSLELTYAPLSWNNTVYTVSESDIENAPQGLTGSYQWTDLWGEGLPGILTEQAQGWFYKSNLGDGHFTPAMAIAEKPSISGLGGALQWADLDANGKRQLVSKSNELPGYYELDDDQDWQPFTNFRDWINVDWESPYTKMLDLNGDGKPDLLVTDEYVWKWYENEGTLGYKEGGYSSVSFDEEKGPVLLHNDMIQVIFLADMNGDGLTDIVRIQNGEVCYWPNKGYGKFGAKVTMSNSPVFDKPDIFDPKYITLSDISGTGAPDLIYIGKSKCTAWINLAGNGWGTPTDIAPLPGADLFSKVMVTDFLGNGTPCIVWSSPLPQHDWAPLRYIDLMGGNKPYLLTSYKNGFGKKVELTYKQSTKYYLEDKAVGKQWATRLPFPVHCVQQIKTTDDISSTTYTQQYSYHHGYYDHDEREFRGFGRVEVIDTDIAFANHTSVASSTVTSADLNQYPVKTISWYHTGAWVKASDLVTFFSTNEYNPTSLASVATIPDLPSGLNPQEQREAYRALKGQPLRQEVYALDGSTSQDSPYTVTIFGYGVKLIQNVGVNRFASFLSYQQQSVVFSCERNVSDPRILHELSLDVDSYGNVLKSAKVCYPRSSTGIGTLSATYSGTSLSVITGVQQKLLCIYTENSYSNVIATNTDRHVPLLYKTIAYEVTGLSISSGSLFTPSGLLSTISSASEISSITAPSTSGTPPLQKRSISQARTLYLSNTTTTILSLGTIESLGIPYQQYHLAITDTMRTDSNWYNNLATTTMFTTEGGYLEESAISYFGTSSSTNLWLPGGTISYDTSHFYVPTSFTDPWGNSSSVSYGLGTTNYYLFPTSVTDAAGNITSIMAVNWRNLQPASITDPNNNVSDILYDILGLPVAVAMKGKSPDLADSLGTLDPNSTADATAQTNFWTNPATNAATLLGSATWRCVYNLDAYHATGAPPVVAMIGREIHSAASGGSTSPLLMRFTYTDGMGRIAMHKVQAAPDESTPTVARWIANGKAVYNNKGKAVMQYEPYFSLTPAYDQAEAAVTYGVTPKMHYDALGRVVRTDLPDGSYTKTVWDNWKQQEYDNNDTLATTGNAWYTAATTDATSYGSGRNDAATKALNHAGTYTEIQLDTLARPFFTRQKDAYPDSSGTWNSYNYDSYVVLDIEGSRLEVHDARGIMTLTYKYNLLKAPLKQTSIDSGAQCILTDAANQPLYSWDATSNRFRETYDALRRMVSKEVLTSLSVTKILEYAVYGETISGALANNLKGKVYQMFDGAGVQTISSYDFKGSPLSSARTYVASNILRPDWNITNRAASGYIESTAYTTSMTYDALGRVKTITTPDGAVTTYVYQLAGLLYSVAVSGVHGLSTGIVKTITYDPKGQRLKLQIQNDTTSVGTVIVTTTYTYDTNTFRLIRILSTKSSGSVILQDLNYWYDPVGNITKQTDATLQTVYFNGTAVSPDNDYTYDALYRLVKAKGREQGASNTPPNYSDSVRMGFGMTVSPTDTSNMRTYIQYYTYDEVGNMTIMKHTAGVTPFANYWTRNFNLETSGSVPINNHLHTSITGTDTTTQETYSYDSRGNMTSGMAHLNSGGANSMVYNEENRLEKVIIDANQTAYYQYGHDGQRVRKVIINSSSGTTKSRKYVGQWELYTEFITSSGTISLRRETLHVMDDAARVAVIDSEINPSTSALNSQNTRYQFSNHLGTAALELDYTAAIISYEEYYAYGGTSLQAGRNASEVSLKRYRYVGKERDEETGFYYMGARYYCSWLCRWVADDPINSEYYNISTGNSSRNHERQHVELTASGYEYCFDNPIRFSDLTGEQPPQDGPEEIKASDIPNDRFEKPSLGKAAFHEFLGDAHKVAAQAFAYGRQDGKNVAGVAMFDYDDHNTIVVTYWKSTVIEAYEKDGELVNEEKTVYNRTFSVFREDESLGILNSIILGTSKFMDLSEDRFFSTGKDQLFSKEVIQMDPFGPEEKATSGIVRAGAKMSFSTAFRYASKYGIKSYEALRGATKGAGLQAHHLIEQRFAQLLKLDPQKMLSIALTPAEHAKFTTLWRLEIGYRNAKQGITTITATSKDVEAAAKKIYKQYPEILKALKL